MGFDHGIPGGLVAILEGFLRWRAGRRAGRRAEPWEELGNGGGRGWKGGEEGGGEWKRVSNENIDARWLIALFK